MKLDRAAVLAAIDARIEAMEKLTTNKYASQADRRVLASSVSALMKAREDIADLEGC